ncbi:hypothetical protein GCM10010521_01980 [Streptomyces rameus]|uniref:Uncharacterized protein n=1 Tax=Streptomyces rameus TaxID=68261 RepID=A0ABP6MKS6_9ACTN
MASHVYRDMLARVRKRRKPPPGDGFRQTVSRAEPEGDGSAVQRALRSAWTVPASSGVAPAVFSAALRTSE